ncbi:unnamed protein product [Amaranthus hypochondriacus]
MDQIWLFSLIISIILPLIYFFFISNYYKKTQTQKIHKTPPSPPSIPIIGHLHLTKGHLYRTFQKLSLKYGSIFSLKFGCLPFVIISSPELVEECFTKNDAVLANRLQTLAIKHIHYDSTTIGAAPYGPLWQNLRRITSLELFSTNRMNTFQSIRVDEVKSLVKGLFGSRKEKKFTKFEMGSKFYGLSLNIITRILMGKRYFPLENNESSNNEGDHQEAEEVIRLIREIFELHEVSIYLGDFLPFLKWMYSMKKVEKRIIDARNKMDECLDSLIEECRKSNDGCQSNDQGKNIALIYKLLDLQELEPHFYNDQIIKGIIMMMLVAGSDTSAVTMEWALSLLLNHPNVMKKARQEIDNYKGNNQLVEEEDLPNLPYIQCIINETFRLFPASPLLVAHEASSDVTISGYHIKKGTTFLVNAWAIHRDPKLWDDPTIFRPERFERLTSDDYKYSLIPFGVGRRSCPAANLAYRVVALSLATLIQCFDWKRVNEEDVELSEGFGLSMPKAKPLEAMCRARESMIDVLSHI